MTEDELRAKYPELSAVGLEVASGWYPLLDDLLTAIRGRVIQHGHSTSDIKYLQIKEKFAALRCYVQTPVDVQDLIWRAEIRSELTCESCGRFGRLRPGGWVTIRCDACAAHIDRTGPPLRKSGGYRFEMTASKSAEGEVVIKAWPDGAREKGYFRMDGPIGDAGLIAAIMMHGIALKDDGLSDQD